MVLTMSDILLRVYLPLQVRFKLLLLMWSISLVISLIFTVYNSYEPTSRCTSSYAVKEFFKHASIFMPIILHFYIHRIFSIKIITELFSNFVIVTLKILFRNEVVISEFFNFSKYETWSPKY